MKKAFALVLTLILVMGLAMPAAAATPSRQAKAEIPKIKADAPKGIVVEVVAPQEVQKLPEAEKKVYEEAQEKIPDKTAYFFFVQVREKTSGKTSDAKVELTVKVKDIPKIADVNKMAIMQFINGEWVELDFVIDKNGKITIFGAVNGPIAFVNK